MSTDRTDALAWLLTGAADAAWQRELRSDTRASDRPAESEAQAEHQSSPSSATGPNNTPGT